jgi:hypothetical protein
MTVRTGTAENSEMANIFSSLWSVEIKGING